MGVISKLQSDVDKLNKLYLPASKSIKRRLINDYEFAGAIADTLGIKLNVPNYNVGFNYTSLFINQVDEYMMDLEGLADVIIEMFREMNFYSFYQISYEYISKHDQELLMKEGKKNELQ